MMIDRKYLLDDEQIMTFITQGYLLVEPQLPPGFNESVYEDIGRLTDNPGNGILDAVPKLREVYDRPEVRGALISLLGEEMVMNGHRHLHTTPPNHLWSQGWHQDGTNVRHHRIWTVLAMYYPQDVPPEIGPTVIMPGSHFRNAPTDRMASYANIKGQIFLTVKAGTVAITHYDIWHAATLNRTDRPRYMLKFLFDRTRAPEAPSWNHDPAAGPEIAQRRIRDMVGSPTGYNSDYYKEWQLRKEMWQWLLGSPGRVQAGEFKDMLS